MAHPAKMLPAIARRAVLAYTQPGDLVLDPMCGIGTSLVEAVHAGRRAVGIEYEPRWADLARANLAHTLDRLPDGDTGRGEVAVGDGRDARRLLDPRHLGRVRLLLTSPPYGSVTHGHVRQTADGRVGKAHHRYSRDPGNLAHRALPVLLGAFTDILTACLPFLADDALVAVTARPWRQAGRLVDFPAAVIDAAADAGLELFERNVALLAGVADHRLVPRASFFALRNLRRAHADGLPVHLVAHEDVLVFTRRP
jgi:hypothetical protein